MHNTESNEHFSENSLCLCVEGLRVQMTGEVQLMKKGFYEMQMQKLWITNPSLLYKHL